MSKVTVWLDYDEEMSLVQIHREKPSWLNNSEEIEEAAIGQYIAARKAMHEAYRALFPERFAK